MNRHPVRVSDCARWTERERLIVKDNYKHRGSRGVAAMLPGRTPRAVQNMANRLGIKEFRRWSDEEVRYLQAMWGRPVRHIAKNLGRTVDAVMAKAFVLGLRKDAWDDMEHLSAAARRAGVSPLTLLRAVRAAGFSVSACPMALENTGTRRVLLNPREVDEAIAKWCGSYTLEAAARAIGVHGVTLRRWFTAATGRRIKPFERVTPQELADVLSSPKVNHGVWRDSKEALKSAFLTEVGANEQADAS